MCNNPRFYSLEVADIKLLPEDDEDGGGHLQHYQTLFAFAERPYLDKQGHVGIFDL